MGGYTALHADVVRFCQRILDFVARFGGILSTIWSSLVRCLCGLAWDNLRMDKRLSVALLKKPLPDEMLERRTEDDWNTGYVLRSTYKKLYQDPSVPEYVWIELFSQQGKTSPRSRSRRIISIVPVVSPVDAENHLVHAVEILVSPGLWFNLRDHSSQPCPSSVTAELCALHSEELPLFFHTVRFSLIRSPGLGDIDVEQWYPFLKEEFKEPRLIHQGDVIALFLPLYLPSSCQYGCIYFKVTQTEPENIDFGLAQADKTFIFLTGCVSHYVPLQMDWYLGDKPWHPLWSAPFPAVLDHYVTELTYTMRTYLARKEENVPLPALLLHGDVGSGKHAIVNALAYRCNMQIFEINMVRDVCADTAAAMESRIKGLFEKAVQHVPVIIYLRHLSYFAQGKPEPRFWRALEQSLTSACSQERSFPSFLIGSCSGALSHELEDLFPIVLEIQALTDQDRRAVTEGQCGMFPGFQINDLETAGNSLAGFGLGDIISQMESAEWERYSRLPRNNSESAKLTSLSDAAHVVQADWDSALRTHQRLPPTRNGSSKISAVDWEDIGGLEDAKLEIMRTVQLPLLSVQIVHSGLQRFGVLLCGPPGNGKTLLAKAIATQCKMNFIGVKGPELVNMYVGQSEENVRSVFERARNAAPCIVFFDELDSLAPNRGRSGDSGGVVDRVVSQLMIEMDGLTRHRQVFVFGATNRPDLLDPALLRPGRFDRVIQVNNPKDAETRRKIIAAVLRKCELSDACTMEAIEELLPADISGADIYAVCAHAMGKALKRLIVQGKDVADPVLQLKDFYETPQEQRTEGQSDEGSRGNRPCRLPELRKEPK